MCKVISISFFPLSALWVIAAAYETVCINILLDKIVTGDFLLWFSQTDKCDKE